MGTDIYLNWDGMTKADHEKQITGFSISSGQVGYLRASIGMGAENQCLHLIFPRKYWNNGGGENGTEFDFIGERLRVLEALKAYAISIKEGKVTEPQPEDKEMLELLTNTFGEIDKVETPGSNPDTSQAATWALSVARFCDLGARLQRQGKHPKVYISW